MNHLFDKTPSLGSGLAWCVMNQFLTQVKSHRGLISFIERRGVNGRWLKPDEPYNIRLSKLIKILEVKAVYQTDDEFLSEWEALGEQLLLHVRTHNRFVGEL